jgi:hypothetical protein
LETTTEDGQKMVTFIKKKVFNSNVYEAFLESAPQFILQCSIILRTGNISKYISKAYKLLSISIKNFVPEKKIRNRKKKEQPKLFINEIEHQTS